MEKEQFHYTLHNDPVRHKCRYHMAFIIPIAQSIEADFRAVHQGTPAGRAWPCSQKENSELRYHQPLHPSGNAALGERLADLRQATGTSGYMGKDPALRVYFSEGGGIYRVHVPRRFRSRLLLPCEYTLQNEITLEWTRV